MSQPSDAPNSLQALRRYVDFLIGTGAVSQINLHGSRSPLTKKQPRDHSDWDIIVGTDIKTLRLGSPRRNKALHADLLILPMDRVHLPRGSIQLWPIDEHKILKGI